MWTMLALFGCSWSDGLLRLDRGLVETIAALDQFFQPRDEACCRSAIDDIVIQTDSQTQVLADGDLPIHDAWLLGDAAQGEEEAMDGRGGYAPATSFAKHPHCCYSYRTKEFLLHLWIPLHSPEESEEKNRQELKRFETLPGFWHVLHLGCLDLVMDLAEGLSIGGSDGVGNGLLLASHVTLNLDHHIHIIKQDEILPAFATCLHGFVLIDCFSQARREERRERQGLPGFRLVFPQKRARPGHIDFEQAMDDGLALG